MTINELSKRDQQVLYVVSQLNQVSTNHLRDLVFSDVNRISMDRAIKRRLLPGKFLRRVGKRAVDNPRGGTPPAVYALGPRGWHYLNRTGAYRAGAVSEHSLQIADMFTALVMLDQSGRIKLLPDTSVEYSHHGMRADIFVDLALPERRERRQFYVEVQRNARRDHVAPKFDAYWAAYEASSDTYWPAVVFVAQDDYIEHEIRRLVPPHMTKLITVMGHDKFLASVDS